MTVWNKWALSTYILNCSGWCAQYISFFSQMVLNKQTRTRCQCFCLRQEMPRHISVTGNVEDEELFSLLPKTKIEPLPSLSIFSFVYVVQILAHNAFCKSCGTG